MQLGLSPLAKVREEYREVARIEESLLAKLRRFELAALHAVIEGPSADREKLHRLVDAVADLRKAEILRCHFGHLVRCDGHLYRQNYRQSSALIATSVH